MEFTVEQQQWIDSHYLLLPVDADGVPIRVGDKAINVNKPSDTYTVVAITSDSVFVYGGNARIKASQVRHVNPRTLEDVLNEYSRAYYAHMVDGFMNYDGTDEPLTSKYAAEIRELLCGDAE